MEKAVKEKLLKLKEKLLDISNRNRMLNSNFQARGKQHFRFIDEIPNNLYETLNNSGMEFIPLPEFDKPTKDENTEKFKSTYEKALLTDPDYLSEIERIETEEIDDINQSTEDAQRSLKNKVRAELGMKSFSGKEPTLEELAEMHGISPSFILPTKSESDFHMDKKIQTLMLPDTFNRFMKNIYKTYKSSIKEQGVNPLYICFGFLEWRESISENKKRYAPILMMPVLIEEKKNSSKLIVSATGDEITINQTLNEKLKKDFRKEFPKIKFTSEEDKSFDINKYLNKFRKTVADDLNFKVINWGSFGIYNAQNMPIYNDLESIIESGASTLLEKLLIGTDINDDSYSAEIHDIDDVSFLNELPNLITMADASQYSAVKDAVDGKDFVIKGPPGTGKSQTITNIIAALMERGKKVLFVAQKQAALDVVRNNLKAVGLRSYLLDIFSTRANKQSVLESFNERLKERGSNARDLVTLFQNNTEKLFKIKRELNLHSEILGSKLGDTGLTVHDILWDTPSLPKNLPNKLHFKDTNESLVIDENQLDANMSEIEFLTQDYKKVFENQRYTDFAISKIKKELNSPFEISDTQKRLNNDYETLKPLFHELDLIESKHSVLKGLDEKLSEVQKSLIKNKPKTTLEKLCLMMSLDDNTWDLYDKLISSNNDLQEFQKKYKAQREWQKDRFDIKDDVISLDQIKNSLVELKNPNCFSFLSSNFRAADKIFKNLYIGDKIKNHEKYNLFYGFYNFKKNEKSQSTKISKFKSSIKALIEEINKKYKDNLKVAQEFNKELFKDIDYEIIYSFRETTKDLDNEIKNLWISDSEILKSYIDLNEKIFHSSKESILFNKELTYSEFSQRNNFNFLHEFKNSKIDLTAYSEWWTNINGVNKSVMNFFLSCVEFTDLKQELPLIYKYVVRHAQNREIFEKYPIYGKYNSNKLKELISQFKDTDKQVQKISKATTSLLVNQFGKEAPNGISRGRVGDKTELGLINHVSEKTRSRTSIRELLHRAGDAATFLKPCTLMSPLTVSQTLPLREIFDVVIIDEASQMKPEFALGSIARAKQVIIVGDPNQLPPTSFFQTAEEDIFDDDISDESILDMALTVLYPPRELLYHYRSKHEDLIKFSNAEFYKNLMIPVTANFEDKEKGIKYLYLKDGLYHVSTEGRSGGFNIIEAEKAVSEAIKIMLNRPNESIGIATMNIKQRDYIEKHFELEASKNKDVQKYLSYWKEQDDGLNEFFIKNLENVQGDERDVIIISTLFGPINKDADPPQRFGGLNTKNGWRRLNVLFTRAKNQMIVISSIKSVQVKVSDKSSRGVEVFKKFLTYLETGIIDTSKDSNREIESPFQQWAIDQINSIPGFSADWEIGEHGFSIDIGVKHEKYPGYLMAVETDGATYHSSLSARDRDILRQEILEGYGWHFYRIWSTDWIKDPVGTKERLHKAIDKRLKECLAQLNEGDS